MKIEYKKYNEIDFTKWDNCVKNSLSDDISGFSWYLDALYENWDALIYDDYNVVMPLPLSKFLNYSYIKQSPLALKTGVFYQKTPKSTTINNFINSIPSNIRSVDFDMENYLIENKKVKLSEKIIYQLDLVSKYKYLYKYFDDEVKQILEEPDIQKITFQRGSTVNQFIDFIVQSSIPTKKNIAKIRLFIASLIRKKQGEIYTAYNSNNTICAAAFFISSHFSINMINIYTEKSDFGRKAAIALVNNYIKENSEKPVTLIFHHHNNKKNIIDFYSGFGCSKRVMMNVKFKRNNKFFNFFKRMKNVFNF